jgi:hypothetical protein
MLKLNALVIEFHSAYRGKKMIAKPIVINIPTPTNVFTYRM